MNQFFIAGSDSDLFTVKLFDEPFSPARSLHCVGLMNTTQTSIFPVLSLAVSVVTNRPPGDLHST